MKTEWIARVNNYSPGILFDARNFLSARSFLAKGVQIVTLISDLY